MSVLGPDGYKAAFIDLDEEVLGGEGMKEAFDRMAVIRANVDDNFSGRDWNLATAMVINGEAGFQMMGDWAKGEFLNAGKVPGEDFLCFRFPGTSEQVTFNADQFMMFDQGGEVSAEQAALATAILSARPSSRPSMWSRARFRRGPMSRTKLSTIAARRAWPIWRSGSVFGQPLRFDGPWPRQPGVGQERDL